MDKYSKKYAKAKGRSMGRFVALPFNMLESLAWRDLSLQAAIIFIELKRRFNGKNNGEIPLSCREAATVAKCGKGTASKKLDELIAHGFINPASKGHFHNRHASTWILTCEVYEKTSPSNELKNYSKIKSS